MISAQSNASILAARGEATGIIAGSPSAAPPKDAEKTARLNADLSTRLDKIRSHAANFLEEKIALKERLKGLSDFQAEAILIGKSFDSAGIPLGRGLDPNDQFQAGYMKEVLEISNQIWGSSLNQRASTIKGAGDFEAGKAVANGMSPGVGSLAHWDGLTSEEQDLVFALTNLTDRNGARRYSTKEQFRAEFARDVEEQQRLMAGPTVGGPSRAERLAIANDMMRHAAGDYKAWQASRGKAGAVVDKIDLSTEGAKAAAETLSTAAPADGALDVQLKALETLKQINAQHHDWLKSLEESDKDKADRPDQSELPEQTLNPQPGSRLSVAA